MSSIENLTVAGMNSLLEYMKNMNSGTHYQDFDYFSRVQKGTGYIEYILKNGRDKATFELGDDMSALIRKFVRLDIPRHNIADFKAHQEEV